MVRSPGAVPAHYLDALLRSTAGARLVGARVFPNAKEVTESFGARRAVTYYADRFPLNDPDVLLVVVGDGTTPRTAATFALTSRWNCHAVDPRLRSTSRWAPIDRLTLHSRRIEDVRLEGDRAVVVMVHAHVSATTALSSVSAAELLLVSMPCCVPPGLRADPELRYHDPGVASPKNEVRVWRFANPG